MATKQIIQTIAGLLTFTAVLVAPHQAPGQNPTNSAPPGAIPPTVPGAAGLAFRRLDASRKAAFTNARPEMVVMRDLDEAVAVCLSTALTHDPRAAHGGQPSAPEQVAPGVEVQFYVTGGGSVVPVGSQVHGAARQETQKILTQLGVNLPRETVIAIGPWNNRNWQVERVRIAPSPDGTGTAQQLFVDLQPVAAADGAGPAAPTWDIVIVPRQLDPKMYVRFYEKDQCLGIIGGEMMMDGPKRSPGFTP